MTAQPPRDGAPGGRGPSRPTAEELDAWLTPWGYPPPGEQRDNTRYRVAAFVHSHPCPDGQGHAFQSIGEPLGREDSPTEAGTRRDHHYRWDCPHETHQGPITAPPFPRHLAAAVWRAEHSLLE